MNLFTKVLDFFGNKENKNLTQDIYGVGDNFGVGNFISQKGDKDEMLRHYSSWVYACINLIAKASSQARFRLYYNKGSDEYEEISNHQVIDLIENPNPFETKYEFLFRAITHLQLTGDSFIYLGKNKVNKVRELYVLQPEKIEIVPHPLNFIEKYVLSDLKQKQEFTPDEIMHFKLPNPHNPYYGCSPLEACAYAVDIDDEQRKYQYNFFKNSAIPPLVLETEQGLDEASIKRLRRDWERLHKGSSASGRTAILERGLKAKSVGVNPKELDWIASNKMTRDDICSVYGVPSALLGLTEDTNKASGQTQEYTFHRQVVEPLLSLIDERLTKSVAKKFNDKYFIKHDSTIPYDSERGARASQIRILSGQTTINEERISQGYKPLDGGDEVLIPLNYALLSNVSNGIFTDGKTLPQGVEHQDTTTEGEP